MRSLGKKCIRIPLHTSDERDCVLKSRQICSGHMKRASDTWHCNVANATTIEHSPAHRKGKNLITGRQRLFLKAAECNAALCIKLACRYLEPVYTPLIVLC